MSLVKVMSVIVTLGLVSGTALAKGDREGRHGRGGDGVERHFSLEKLKELDLSPEQKEKLKALRENSKEERHKNMAAMKEAKEAFKTALKSNASKEEVAKAYQKMTEQKRAIGQARFDKLLEAREILTVDQRKKLFEKDDEE